MATTETPAASITPSRRRRNNNPAWMAAVLVVGIALGAGGVALAGNDSGDKDPFAGRVDAARYQAVILSNDKVYFGRISPATDEFFRLQDAFFLQEKAGATSSDPPVRTLRPLNDELQAPENSMLIRRADVVLIENLDKSSPILKEIQRQKGK